MNDATMVGAWEYKRGARALTEMPTRAPEILAQYGSVGLANYCHRVARLVSADMAAMEEKIAGLLAQLDAARTEDALATNAGAAAHIEDEARE